MQPFGFLLLLVISLLHAGICNQCPPDWSYFQGLCYGYGTTAVSWGSAQAICNVYGGRLAEPSSRPENNFVTSMARRKRGQCAWLGGSDMFHEGVWEWSSRHSPFSNFTNWDPSEPNNFANDEDCLNLFRPHNYKWNDESCANKCNFVCAVPPTGDHALTVISNDG